VFVCLFKLFVCIFNFLLPLVVNKDVQIQGKKAYGRPRTMLLDWLLKTEEGNISYEELKMFARLRTGQDGVNEDVNLP